MGPTNKRLREARKAAGFKSARQAATQYGWPPSTYASHENGQTNPVPQDDAERYARAFKVRTAWILTGDEPRSAGKSGQEQSLNAGFSEEADPIVIQSGDRVLYVEEKRPPADLIGRECAVKLPDGRLLVRTVRPGSTKRVFNLEAPGAPALTDQRLEWAAPVRGRA